MKIIAHSHQTDLDPPRHEFILESEEAIHLSLPIMDAWLRDNMQTHYRRSPRTMAHVFLVDLFSDDDAMLFKLVWA